MIIIAILISVCLCISAAAELTVTFLDVGQGDAIILSCDGRTALIDAGTVEMGPTVNGYLTEQCQISELAAVIATHNHDDHIGGMPGALTGLTVDTVISPPSVSMFYWFDNVQPVLNQSSLNVMTPMQGDSYSLGNAVLTFLNADDPLLSPNNRSAVIRVDYGETSFLLMGDAEADEEQQLLDCGAELKADVMKIGHHGGLGSTGSNLLSAVSPTHAIISVGAGNDHGHPAPETVTLLQSKGISIYRTDLDGNIICVSDGENITVEITKATVN